MWSAMAEMILSISEPTTCIMASGEAAPLGHGENGNRPANGFKSMLRTPLNSHEHREKRWIFAGPLPTRWSLAASICSRFAWSSMRLDDHGNEWFRTTL